MGRMVTLDTGWQTVSAAQDLLEAKLASGQVAVLHSLIVMQSSEEAASEAEILQVSTKLGVGNTSGSGGGSATVLSQGGAHGLTGAERNNTTQAVAGGGSLADIPLFCGAMNVLAGEFERTVTPEMRPIAMPSESFIVAIEAPADAVTMRAVMVIELLAG